MIFNRFLNLVWVFLVSCSTNSKEKNGIADFFGNQESASVFLSSFQQDITEYESLRDSNNKKLIVINNNFELGEKDNLYLFLNGKLAYDKKTNALKLPGNLNHGHIVNPTVTIIKDDKAYSLSTKASFTHDSTALFYYLSFHRDNRDEIKFTVIPSHAEVK
jgi:hypothetical protein